MPAAVGLFTTEIDLTDSGVTFNTNRDIDIVLKAGLPEMNQLYANGHDLANPYLLPLVGDLTKGFAPTFIQIGTRDLFLSDAVCMHPGAAAGADRGRIACLGGNAAWRLWQRPEEKEIRSKFTNFLAKHAGWAGP